MDGEAFIFLEKGPELQELLDVGVDPWDITAIDCANNYIRDGRKNFPQVPAGNFINKYFEDYLLMFRSKKWIYAHLDYYGVALAQRLTEVQIAASAIEKDGRLRATFNLTPNLRGAQPFKFAEDVVKKFEDKIVWWNFSPAVHYIYKGSNGNTMLTMWADRDW